MILWDKIKYFWRPLNRDKEKRSIDLVSETTRKYTEKHINPKIIHFVLGDMIEIKKVANYKLNA